MADSELVAERPPTPEHPAHLSVRNIGLVAAGGAVGTALRYAITLVLPAFHGVPVAIFTVNVVGAFLLGVLLETLAELGPDHGVGRRLRLGLGTGVLGGFTTYSTLATDIVTLVQSSIVVAVAYAVGTVIIGGLASISGIVVARRRLRPVIKERAAAR